MRPHLAQPGTVGILLLDAVAEKNDHSPPFFDIFPERGGALGRDDGHVTQHDTGNVVPGHVGNAVRRNRIKRMLREAFRLSGDALGVYDLIVVPSNHDPLSLDEYRALLTRAAEAQHRHWEKMRMKDESAQ